MLQMSQFLAVRSLLLLELLVELRLLLLALLSEVLLDQLELRLLLFQLCLQLHRCGHQVFDVLGLASDNIV